MSLMLIQTAHANHFATQALCILLRPLVLASFQETPLLKAKMLTIVPTDEAACLSSDHPC